MRHHCFVVGILAKSLVSVSMIVVSAVPWYSPRSKADESTIARMLRWIVRVALGLNSASSCLVRNAKILPAYSRNSTITGFHESVHIYRSICSPQRN